MLFIVYKLLPPVYYLGLKCLKLFIVVHQAFYGNDMLNVKAEDS